ncbi:choice-of-anchor L domain-containing protein [Flavobacterium sp. XGLA_31]|uniref:choice-of-anchor L domain-containing protein n=1 Tax=Flavobacterium sp. XGLA_31 TaxID=3447666 RepID=UPI003F2CB2F6
MKKLLLIITLLFALVGFSQPITVSTTSHTVPQLVNNVLINSPCVSATNITWSTGTNFGSSNGIGFFQNSNPGFPMSSGVVLSTGNAMNAAGPNTSPLNDGSITWPGDTSLEATLAASGITMVSKNATVLEFDFTPISSNFSFDFIFASEEYGNFQCHYSDAFAFLLTNMNTGVTTNLAVVPNTTLPISVVTIRDFQYNSSCPSANAQYFGSFNGGSAASGSATNFNGQTKVLTAASNLTPNVPYHIKLVIADRLDPQSDSAIFISSDSFNIGQDVLGQDALVANNTAICFGQTHTLTTGLSTTDYSFTWKKDGVTIPGETGSSLIINQPGTYSVSYSSLSNFCQPITDSIVIEYYPEIVTANPVNVYKCNSGAASYTFNLDLNTPIVKEGLDPSAVVSYHISQADADNDINPLPLQYNSASGQTIYVRIELPSTSCYTVKSFQLLTSPGPIANQPADMIKCSRSQYFNNAYFNLNSQTASILNGQSSDINIVSYYSSLLDASNGTNAIANPQNILLSDTTIYVRVQNVSDPLCYSVTSFNIVIEPAPPVDDLDNVIVCTSYILPELTNGNYFTAPNGNGIPLFAGNEIIETQTIYIYNQPDGPGTCASSSSFQVKILDPETLSPLNVTRCGSYTLPHAPYGDYYTLPGGQGTLIPPGTVYTASTVIHFYYETEVEPFCAIDTDCNITILPLVEVGSRADVFECTSYTLPALSIGDYYTGPGGTGNMLHAGDVITTSQTLYVYASSNESSTCSDEDSFEVIIGMPQPADVNQCNGYTLPALPIGNYYTGPHGTGTVIPAGTVINSSTTVYIYAATTSGSNNCTDNMHFTLNIAQPEVDSLSDVSVCESYTLPTLVHGSYRTGIDGTGNLLYAGDVIVSTQTIYIFERLNATCFNQTSFTVTVNTPPNIDSRSDIDICDQYTLTALNVGNYYTGPNGSGTMLTPGTVITTSQRIYIYAVSNTTPPCSIENSFQINIFSTTADDPADVVACDSYTLPALTAGNKYYTQSGGPDGTGTEIPVGTIITTSQTIYVFKESLIRVSFSCMNENTFTVTINNTPVIPATTNFSECNSFILPALTIGDYYTGTNGSGTLLHAGDTITSSQTIYVFAHTATSPDCTSEKSFVVNLFNVDNLPNITSCENYTLPTLTVGNYYTGPNGTGTHLLPGSVIATSQTIYIYGLSPFTSGCADESSFTVTIIDEPVAHSVPAGMRTLCDEDGTNDGATLFNLTTLSSTVLGSQTGTEFTIAYYESLVDASNQTNAVTSSSHSPVYVRVSNTLAPNCYDIKPITIIVNKLPNPTPIDGVICIDSETGALLNPYTIYTNLPGATHTFVWTNENGQTVGAGSSYQAVAPGVYTVVATHKITGCASEPVSVTVIPSEPAVVTFEVREDFEDHQSIIVTATGQGNNFEYQLDDSGFQDSPIFNDVHSGIHMITVRDKYGCGSVTVKALVVNYPKFFTPNGDGINDTWNIKDLSGQPSALITIYDRYGKVLKQIRPSGYGWDGIYNGHMMPSDDYWFSVNYKDENQEEKEFKAHFAMKR